MIKSVAIFIAVATSVALLISSFSVGQLVRAQQLAMDLTKPSGDKPFGGEKIGTVQITPNGHVLTILANVTSPPDNGKVWEGWLVDDDGGSGYKLSLGEFAKNGTLHLVEQMVNPYTYTQFIVTQEPFEDPDPNAAAAFGGTQLQTPFGR
jgi:hypothetical protein